MKTEKPDVLLWFKDRDNNGTKEWVMKVGQKGEQGPGQYDKLVVGQGDDGIFVFEIKSPGITFNPDDPIDIRLQAGGTDLSNQFISRIVNDKLVVADPNTDQEPAEYYYQLNFVAPTPPLDPIITNGCCKSFVSSGGGGDGMQLMSVTGALVILAVALVLAVAFNAVARWLK